LSKTTAHAIGLRLFSFGGNVPNFGWPYVQHRGGAPGFLRVVSPTQLAFADYKGNRQLLTTASCSPPATSPPTTALRSSSWTTRAVSD